MKLPELMDRIIEEGIRSVQETETSEERLRGGIAGFELCRGLLTLEEFEKILGERHQKEQDLRIADQDIAAYWEYRCATIQVEYCYEIVKVAYGRYPLSARAVLRYHEIVGPPKET